MEFKILDVVYQKTSGSLSNVIQHVNYQFVESGSGEGADSGSLYQASAGHTVTLFPIASASFKAYDSVTEANVKTWVENAHITHSSADGAITASLWNEWTASNAQNISQSLADQINPPMVTGKPW